MTLKTRRILYILFILLFVILVPLISLYSAGYTLGSGFKIQKTGILIIDTDPEGARITINNKVQLGLLNKLLFKKNSFITSPAKIKNLPPGEYDIKLSKTDYWDWEKKLTIKPGESTYIEDVSLFKKDIPIILIDGDFRNFFQSPDNKYIAAFSKNSAVLYDLSKDKVETFTHASTSSFRASGEDSMENWSSDNKKIIHKGYIFDIKDWQNPFDAIKEIGGSISNIRWFDNTSIFYKSDAGLNKYSLSSRINEPIPTEVRFEDFYFSNNTLYLLEENEMAVILNSLRIGEKISNKINLPISAYSFLNLENNYLNIHDDVYNILYIVDPGSDFKPLKESISNALLFQWIEPDKLLYANRHEIWVFDIESRKNTLLTRISQDILGVIWHPNNNYVIYNTADSIFSIELDDREKFNITKLVNLGTISDPILNKQGDTLFFFSQIGNQKGIYKLFIQ